MMEMSLERDDKDAIVSKIKEAKAKVDRTETQLRDVQREKARET